MIAVVADTSPLNYLIQIDRHQVLPILYQRILILSAVARELLAYCRTLRANNCLPDFLVSSSLTGHLRANSRREPMSLQAFGIMLLGVKSLMKKHFEIRLVPQTFRGGQSSRSREVIFC